MSIDTLRTLLHRFMDSQRGAASCARINLHFEQLVRRAALSSANSGWRAYPASIDASLIGGSLAVELTTEALYSSTCPASVALARPLLQQQFAHDFAAGATLDRAAVSAWLGSAQGVVATPGAQRSIARVRVQLAHDAGSPLLRLLDSVDGRGLGLETRAVVRGSAMRACVRQPARPTVAVHQPSCRPPRKRSSARSELSRSGSVLTRTPSRTVAAFAPAAAEAARQGDAVARQWLRDAATACADSIIAGAAILNEASLVPVVMLGGLTEMGALLQDPPLEVLGRSDARSRVHPAQGTSSDEAGCLATHDDGIQESWMMRVDPGVIRFGNSFATSKGDHA